MSIIEVKRGQWLGDIAIVESGDFEVIFELAVVNDLSITDLLNAGTELQSVTIADKRVVNYLKRKSLSPATEIEEKNES